MQLVEQHIISYNHKYYKDIDFLCFQSKNLYNSCNYFVRQRFFEKQSTSLKELYAYIKHIPEYTFLPRKVSNEVLKLVLKNWLSYYRATKAYNKDSSSFLGKPNIPKYKDKVNGRNILVYDKQALSFKKENNVKLSQTDIDISTRIDRKCINQVRIVVASGYYMIEIVYRKEKSNREVNENNIVGIDMGVNNLCSLTSNKLGLNPILINGRIAKSMNQYYNKTKALYQSKLPSKQYSSKRIEKLTRKRNNKIKNHMHHVSKFIVDYCVKNDIGTIVIGKNDGWKQKVNIGKRNNQNFVFLPFAKLIEMIDYKAELQNISVVLTEESYTSKCSFYHREEMIHSDKYIGERVKRGLFKTKEILINSDINGSLNIIRKAFSNAFKSYGIEGISVSPITCSIKNKLL